MIVQDSWFITRFWDACIWCVPLSVSAPWCDWSGESQGRCRSFTVQVSEMNWNDMIIWDLRWIWICIICVYIYNIRINSVFSLSLSIYIYRVIHTYMHSQISNPPRPFFLQLGRAAPDFSLIIVPGGWRSFEAHDHPSKWLISGGSSSRALQRHSLGFSENFWCPQLHCFPIFFCHNWNCHLGSTSHFQTHSLHAAERCLSCGRNCLCKSLGRKHVAWGATREKVCGEIDFHCHKGRIRMVPAKAKLFSIVHCSAKINSAGENLKAVNSFLGFHQTIWQGFSYIFLLPSIFGKCLHLQPFHRPFQHAEDACARQAEPGPGKLPSRSPQLSQLLNQQRWDTNK